MYGYPYYKQYLQGHYQHGMVMSGSFTPNLVNSTGDAVAMINAFNLTTNNMSIGHYEAYGTALATAYAGNPYGYRGYYTDSETGFSYLNARYYDPATQRFTQEDTYWGDNLQRNLYAYCSGNPVMFIDPSGHYKQVQQGSKGDDVRTLQKLLNAHGANLAVDGDFGPMTKAAVVAYQKAAGNLAVDGIAGKNTWESLLSSSPSNGGRLTGGNQAQGTGKTISYDVPLYSQKDLPLCWAYCQVMVEAYYSGENMTQDQADARAKEIAISVNGEKNWDRRGGWPTNSKDSFWIFSWNRKKSVRNFTDLQNALADGPVYAYYSNDKWWSPKKFAAHMVVVTGAVSQPGQPDMVYSNNPWRKSNIQTFDDFIKGIPGDTDHGMKFKYLLIPKQ